MAKTIRHERAVLEMSKAFALSEPFKRPIREQYFRSPCKTALRLARKQRMLFHVDLAGKLALSLDILCIIWILIASINLIPFVIHSPIRALRSVTISTGLMQYLHYIFGILYVFHN